MPTGNTDFVGRSAELDRLGGLLARVEDERTAAALVGGDAGVGKTRLISEVSARAEGRGFRVLIGGCMETGDLGLPYVPFVDAFRSLGRDPAELQISAQMAVAVPSLARLLPTLDETRPPVLAGQDGLDQVELFGGIHSLLGRLAAEAPLLLIMEDIHWADRSTRDLLSFLLRTLRTGRVGLIATYRSDELHRTHPLRPLLAEIVRLAEVERIDLHPFDRGELTEYLTALTGTDLDQPTIDRILERSEGNAFFAEELVAAGAAAGDAPLPEALADVLRDRIETLPASTQELLKVAAVAGRRVDHGSLVAASNKDELEIEPDLRAAIAGQILVADADAGTYRFRHALLQEAVYTDLLPGERSRLHGAYARLLAERGNAAELAYHCLASHDLKCALAALIQAASEATGVAAPAEALGHLTQALEIWGQIPDAEETAGVSKVRVLLRAAAAAGNIGEFKRAIAFARTAVKEAEGTEDELGLALAYERLGEHLYQGDSPAEATLAAFRKAVALVPEEPPSQQRARVTAGLARALLGWRMHDEARRWCDEALANARAVGAKEDETHALNTLATLEMRHDNIEEARVLILEARSRAEEIGASFQELRAQFNLGAMALDQGDLPAAKEALDDAIVRAEKHGLIWGQYGINSNVLRLFTYYAIGLWDEAEAIAATLDERILGTSYLSAAILYVEVARGRNWVDERIAYLGKAGKNLDWVRYMRAGCGADRALYKGELEEAEGLIDAILDELVDAEEGWELSAIWPGALGITVQAEIAELAGRVGNDEVVDGARAKAAVHLERCRKAIEYSKTLGRQIGPEARAWVARAEAEAARLEKRPSTELWRAATEAFSYGYRYEEARSRFRLAEALVGEGNRDEADTELREAHRVAAGLGADPLREMIEALSRRARIDLGAGLSAPGDLAGLTPRELEVLALIAEGRSNQQIADALFISRKTASVHVSHILSKLGVTTRGEAAAAAHRAGLPGEGST